MKEFKCSNPTVRGTYLSNNSNRKPVLLIGVLPEKVGISPGITVAVFQAVENETTHYFIGKLNRFERI